MTRNEIKIKTAIELGRLLAYKSSSDSEAWKKGVYIDYDTDSCAYVLNTNGLRIELGVGDRYSSEKPFIIAEFNAEMPEVLIVNELTDAILIYEKFYKET